MSNTITSTAPPTVGRLRIKLPNKRRIRWAKRILSFLILIAFFGDFIANDKPLYAHRNDQISFPVVESYLVGLGLKKWPVEVFEDGWKNLEYESVIWPLIPYTAQTLDRRNTGFVSPFAEQKINGLSDRHWLGTDQLGRDVAAGLISGTRTAVLVGLISMSIAGLIGILLGGFAGFFGDDSIKFSRLRLFLLLLGIFLGLFWGFISRPFLQSTNLTPGSFFLSVLMFSIPVLLFYWLGKWIENKWQLTTKLNLQIDLIVMRAIEILGAVPGILLILSLVAVFEKSSLYIIMVIIGFLYWPSIARYMRAEMIRLRSSNFVESLRAMGYGDMRILFLHCIPNGLSPVLITLAFGMGGAILTEAALTFLGIGVSLDQVTWGSMLTEARTNFSAWWMALLPGILIFLTVGSLNIIGEGLSQALNPGQAEH